MKQKIGIGLLMTFMVYLVIHSYFAGRQRNVFTVEPLGKYVPIPEIYDLYQGSYEWRDDRSVKTLWNLTEIHPNQSRTYFVCEGRIWVGEGWYYLLEMDGKRYMEKAANIEPLIHALLALSRGNNPDDHEATIEESIVALPEDREQLDQLAKRIKK